MKKILITVGAAFSVLVGFWGIYKILPKIFEGDPFGIQVFLNLILMISAYIIFWRVNKK